MGREDEIRVIAYSIWEEEGCPNGRDCEHWFRAEVIWEQQQNPSRKVESKIVSKQAVKPTNRARTSGKKKQN